jgi:hypothetical protein
MLQLDRGYLLLLLVALVSAGAMGWRYQHRSSLDGERQMLMALGQLGWQQQTVSPLLGGTYVSYQLRHPGCGGVLQAMVVAPDREAMSVRFVGTDQIEGVMFQGQWHPELPLLAYRFSQGWHKLWGDAPAPLYRVALPADCLALIVPGQIR